jgi:hypothetical protein
MSSLMQLYCSSRIVYAMVKTDGPCFYPSLWEPPHKRSTHPNRQCQQTARCIGYSTAEVLVAGELITITITISSPSLLDNYKS